MEEANEHGTPEAEALYSSTDLRDAGNDAVARPAKQPRTANDAAFKVLPGSNRPQILRSVVKGACPRRGLLCLTQMPGPAKQMHLEM